MLFRSAVDVCMHGASGGVSGFTTNFDTVNFANKYRLKIRKMLSEQCSDVGYASVGHMVQSFNCLGKEFSLDTINEIVYSTESSSEDYTQIMNALAWYSLEETCRLYIDIKENN